MLKNETLKTVFGWVSQELSYGLVHQVHKEAKLSIDSFDVYLKEFASYNEKSDLTKILQIIEDKITVSDWFYDLLAKHLKIQLLDFDEAKKTALHTICILRGLPYAGLATLMARYIPNHFTANDILNFGCLPDEDLENVLLKKELTSYKTLINTGLFQHSTPTQLNYWKKDENKQLSSCFQLFVDDNTESIMGALTEAAQYSRRAGGVALHVNVRERGASVAGRSNNGGGVVSVCRMFEAVLKHFNQQGQRSGAGVAYIDVTHPDIMDFLSVYNVGGSEDQRLTLLNIGVCLNDKFMRAVQNNENWYLISPAKHPHLVWTAGADFEASYDRIVAAGDFVRATPAREIMAKIVSNMQTKSCFIFFKDTEFKVSGEVHLGSNLCTETILKTDNKNSGVCNLGSINLYRCALQYISGSERENPRDIEGFYAMVGQVAHVAVKALLAVLHSTHTPTEKGRMFQTYHPTVGLGVMGEAMAMDVLGVKTMEQKKEFLDLLYKAIHENTQTTLAVRTLAIAPTESISVIGGCSPSIELPVSKEFVKGINKSTIKILYPFYNDVLAFDADAIDAIDLAAVRQPYIDQAQSLNLFIRGNDKEVGNKILQCVMHAWKSGLKTLYYVRQDATTQKSSCSMCVN